MIGKTVGSYRITEEIGNGGMGRVYKAVHVTLDRAVAMKMIHPGLLGNLEIINRFYKEAKIQAQLNHPNIVTVYDFLEVGSAYFIIMEYVYGESLAKILSKQGAFEAHVAVSVFLQILDGIGYAHSKGVVHRDIKPNNFILTQGFVKITDFGIAQIICDIGLNTTSRVVGTPKYMSPEQILGKRIDHRTDIYSLGVTFYEMLTGSVPFNSNDGSDYEIKRGHVELPPPLLSEIKPDLSNELANVVQKALSKKPEERFQTADDFRLALENICGNKKEGIPTSRNHLNPVNKGMTDSLSETAIKSKGKLADLSNGEEGFDEKGNLDVISYPALLFSLHRERRTGFLILDSEVNLRVYFLEGFVAFVEGDNAGLALGEMLVESSKISEAERENVVTFAHETGLKIGEALIKMGKISPHELNSALETQIKEKLIEGFRCKSGSYRFKNTGNFTIEAMYKINPIQVVYQAVTRFIRNVEIPNSLLCDVNSAVVPSPDMKEELKNVAFQSTKELKLIDLIRGQVSLKEIVSRSPLNARDTSKFLYFLSLAGLVEIDCRSFILEDDRQLKEDIRLTSDQTELLTEQEVRELRQQVSFRERLRKH
ncbi:MAG TPA: protein kinase [Thermodesulfobacteriota bacterium]|nr:protein kinase [Thermodesulfobacteriota bacterium]